MRRSALPLAALLAAVCGLPSVVKAQQPRATTDVLDDRLTLRPSGACSAERRVMFEGKPAAFSGNVIRGLGGAPLYTAAAPILDVAPVGVQNAVLTANAVTIVQGKRRKEYALGLTATSGRLIFARPDALLYYLTAGGRTFFYAHSAARQRMYYAAGPGFVDARADAHGNTIVALADRVVVISRENRVLPLVQMAADAAIEGLEVTSPEDALLVRTRRGLLKITSDARTHSLLAGRGTVQLADGSAHWCAADGSRSALVGVDDIGTAASDRAYARVLLERTRKLLDMGVEDGAFTTLVKISELVPDSVEAKRLASVLARRLNTREGRPNR